MPRNHIRKIELNFLKASKALVKALEQSDPIALPKSRRGVASVDPETAGRLLVWLAEFARQKDSFSFSMLLQFWLTGLLKSIPPNVFKDNLWSLGRGRPRSDLGLEALALYQPQTFGWGKVAKKLVPEKYERDPNTAIKYIRDLAQSAERDPIGCGDYELEMAAGMLLGEITMRS